MPDESVVLTDALAADLLKSAEARQRSWFWSFWAWTLVHWLFAAGSVIAATLAASQAKADTTRYYAVIAAISGALLTVLNPQRRAGGYISAWTVMDIALDRFRFESRSATIVRDAKARGEAMIRGGEVAAAETSPLRRPTIGGAGSV